MRSSKTHHLETIRIADSGQVSRNSPLNIALLLSLLRESLDIDNRTDDTILDQATTGKKRARSDSPLSPRKKQKIEARPSSEHPFTTAAAEAELVPAFRHVFEFTYAKEQTFEEVLVDGDTPEHLVQDLEAFLSQYQPTLEMKSYDLAKISTSTKDYRVCIYPTQGALRDTLLALPSIVDINFDLREDDYRTNASYLHDVIYCSQLLHTARKADVSSRLRIEQLSPNDPSSHDKLPFRISVEVTVSLICPVIFQETPKDVKLNADIERRVLNYVFPPNPVPPPMYSGDTDIPFMYSALRPPPDLSSQIADMVQPAALVSTLLPFQRRSVAWMLRREGKTIDEQGQLSPIAELETPLFWEEVELAGRAFYLHRLKGLLTAVAPEAETQPGGSLNEPPGMGKTVECIALTLLNPGIGRNPSVKRWDSEARVFVKQIKARKNLLYFSPFLTACM